MWRKCQRVLRKSLGNWSSVASLVLQYTVYFQGVSNGDMVQVRAIWTWQSTCLDGTCVCLPKVSLVVCIYIRILCICICINLCWIDIKLWTEDFPQTGTVGVFFPLRKNFNTEEEFRAFLGNAEARQSCLAEVGVRIGVRSGDDETSCSSPFRLWSTFRMTSPLEMRWRNLPDWGVNAWIVKIIYIYIILNQYI